MSRELYLFGETHGCAWVTVDGPSLPDLLALSQELGCMARHAGKVGGDRIRITDAHQLPVLDLPVAALRESWSTGFCDAVGLPRSPERP